MYTLVDTNLIVYSLNSASPKCKRSQKFIRDNQAVLCLSHQNILEAVRVLTHPKYAYPMSSQKANKFVWNIAEALRLIVPSQETIYLVKEFVSQYKLKADGVFDAYLVATALTNGVKIIATDNVKHFKKYKEIKLIDPYE